MWRYHRGFSAPFRFPLLEDDRYIFGKLFFFFFFFGEAQNKLMAPCQKGNSNHFVNVSTNTNFSGLYTDYWGLEWDVSTAVCFALGVFSLLAFCLRVTETSYFCKSVNSLFSLQMLFKRTVCIGLDCSVAVELLDNEGVQ